MRACCCPFVSALVRRIATPQIEIRKLFDS